MKKTGLRNIKNALEWTVFGISLALVLAIVGMLTYAAVSRHGHPAQLTVTTGKPSFSSDSVSFPVNVKNDGGSAATEVEVRIRIGTGDEMQEAGFTIDFIPRGGTRKGAVSFQTTDISLTPQSRIVGYAEP